MQVQVGIGAGGTDHRKCQLTCLTKVQKKLNYSKTSLFFQFQLTISRTGTSSI